MEINSLTNDNARKMLDNILSSPEFTRYSLEDQFDKFFTNMFKSVNLGELNVLDENNWPFWLGVFISLAVLVLFIYLGRNSFPFWNFIVKDVKADVAEKSVYRQLIPASFLAEAEEKAVRGNYRDALRCIYLAGLLEMDKRGLVSYTATKTNYEYLREIGKKAAGVETSFRALIDLFEYKWYGLEGCSLEDFQKGRELYTSLLRDGFYE